MRVRGTERAQIIALLDAEWDDAEALANAVVAKAWDLLVARGVWCVVMDAPGVGVAAFGPYASRNEATKAVGTSIVAPGPGKATGYIRELRRPDGN